MSLKKRLIKPFSNRRADENGATMGRMWIGITAGVIILLCLLSVFGLFIKSTKDIREKDRERRQEQKDSIGFKVPLDCSNLI